jgi:transcription-repair coupling factor (superfamily II helicase)
MDLSFLTEALTPHLPPIPAAGAPLRAGVPDAAKAAFTAALLRKRDRPSLVIVAKAARARELADELAAWLGPEGAGRVRLCPERDALPYERGAPDPWETQARLDALAALAGDAPSVVVASVAAVGQRTGPPAAAIGGLKVGDRSTPETLLGRLLGAGYTVVPLVEAPGQAARRGGIVDLYPPRAESPLRVEFFGSNVESIRSFDVATQRSQTRVDAVDLGPAGELAPPPHAAEALAERLDFSDCNEEAAAALQEELRAIAAGEPADPESFLPALLSTHTLLDHLADGGLVVLDDPADLARALDEAVAEAAAERFDGEARGRLPKGLPSPLHNWSDLRPGLERNAIVELSRFATEEGGAVRPPFAPAPGYGGRLRALANETQAAAHEGEATVIVSQQAARLANLLEEQGLGVRHGDGAAIEPGGLVIVRGALPAGWLLRGTPSLRLLTDAEVFGFAKQRRVVRPPASGRGDLIADLSPGDLVVHIEHGIGRFNGLVTRSIEGVEREYLELLYAENDRLFVPVEQADRVARYQAGGEHRPSLTRLGSGEWARTKDRVRRAVTDIAKDLIDLYAARQVIEGHAFTPDTPWQAELDASFPYEETPDQLEAIAAVKADMESVRPMDRLICGDVGFGKTEVAVRAAFKAVMDGYQVAILVPTTVLAQQHYNTFRERLAGFPIRVAMLSRFLNDREQAEVTKALAAGEVDIVIGTHRLLQKDVQLLQLGLVIIDEEQRFGVAHKERLKQMRKEVDVLTLSATPIPRTLHMALAGIRDMSHMLSAPEDRSPIRTYVLESDDGVIREAIVRELERGGQVFFVHNRVHNIELVAARIRRLVPDATVGIGHGQMAEDQLEKTMLAFASGELDVLVCTTIIESGLDIPNANTIIINQADRLGLAQLYQLRGRVGRGSVHAYAYLVYDRDRALSETAQKRLQAIFAATELGAGFQIALHDLEIRGAGNLLGAEQSGSVQAVGFDLYGRILNDAVERLQAIGRGEEPPVPSTSRPPVSLDLPLTAYLPEGYIPDLNLRLAVYQRLSRATDAEAIDEIERELADRFGTLPGPARSLLWVVRLRILCAAAGIASVQVEGEALVIRTQSDREIDRAGIARRLPQGTGITTHQVRLDRRSLGDGWREAIVRTVAALSAPVLAPV